MLSRKLLVVVAVAVVIGVAPAGETVLGQAVPGITDVNAMPEAQLTALPGVTAAVAKALVAKRPFATVKELHDFLIAQGVTAEQTTAIYEKAFVHINLNTGTAPEILLVPRISRRMTREFEEYRPWRTLEQFDREIGKYVGAEETNRLKKYVYIPIDINNAADDVIMTIPGMTPRMLREFKEYRPWKTKDQFDKEIGKYVGAQETARLWRYVVIQ